ncbi:MAG: hypothetical protein RIM80_12110, partial [Alphaproteobacteria bacterium]
MDVALVDVHQRRDLLPLVHGQNAPGQQRVEFAPAFVQAPDIFRIAAEHEVFLMPPHHQQQERHRRVRGWQLFLHRVHRDAQKAA